MQKMAAGGKARLLDNGGLRLGATQVPSSLVDELSRRDLISKSGKGSAELSEAGVSYLRRMNAAHHFAVAKKPGENNNIYKAQHTRLDPEEIKVGTKQQKFSRNIGETPLGWLLRRKDRDGRPYLNENHFNAGEKLAADYEYAGLLPRTVSYYDGVPVSGKKYYSGLRDDSSLVQLAAKRRINAALEYVGPGLSDILIRVCCYHEGLEQAEKQLFWPTRSAKLVLKIALERLAEHYNPEKK